MSEAFSTPLSVALRAVALALPETSEGTSCLNRAFKVRKKNFVFVGERPDRVRVMLKLGPSLEAARAAADPRVSIGKFGWVTVEASEGDHLPTDRLAAWIDESYRLLAPKSLVKQLPPR